MRNTRLWITALAAAPAVGLLSGGSSQVATVRGRRCQLCAMFGAIAFEPCTLASPLTPTSIDAQCAKFDVAENPAQPTGRKITLNIAWLPARDQGGGTTDPVFFLAGGPGQAATEYAAQVDMALRDVRKQRDIVLIDQRGTGKLSPLLCRDSAGKELALPDDRRGRCRSDRRVRRPLRTGPQRKGRSAFLYDHRSGARPGSGAASPWASTRSTWSACRTARASPSSTRRGIRSTRARSCLTASRPTRWLSAAEFARTFERALGLQVAQCQQLPSCRKRFPQDLRAQLRGLKTRLQASPVEVEYRDPSSGRDPERHAHRRHRRRPHAYLFSYMPQMASLLPVVIDEADHGRYAPLMALAQMMTREMGGQMYRAMQWSVICSEDADRYRADPADADTVLGADVAGAFFAACRSWPHGPRPDGFQQAAASRRCRHCCCQEKSIR